MILNAKAVILELIIALNALIWKLGYFLMDSASVRKDIMKMIRKKILCVCPVIISVENV